MLEKFEKWINGQIKHYIPLIFLGLFLTVVSLLDQYAFNNSLQVSAIFDDFVRSNLVNPYEMAMFYFICFSHIFIYRNKQRKALHLET